MYLYACRETWVPESIRDVTSNQCMCLLGVASRFFGGGGDLAVSVGGIPAYPKFESPDGLATFLWPKITHMLP